MAFAQFSEHDCKLHPSNGNQPETESHIGKMRLLVMRGSSPEEAAGEVLKEVSSRYPDQPATIDKVRKEADEFLRRIREGFL